VPGILAGRHPRMCVEHPRVLGAELQHGRLVREKEWVSQLGAACARSPACAHCTLFRKVTYVMYSSQQANSMVQLPVDC